MQTRGMVPLTVCGAGFLCGLVGDIVLLLYWAFAPVPWYAWMVPPTIGGVFGLTISLLAEALGRGPRHRG